MTWLAVTGILVSVPVACALLYLSILASGPLPDRTVDHSDISIVIHDALGQEIGLRGRHKRPVELSTLPGHTIAAFLAIEDRRFFDHQGIDVIGIGRALQANYKAQAIVEGGSTITQQLVKNVYLDSERTLERKIEEAVLAMRLERQNTKQEILEQYLYTVYFGNNAYGIEAAAESYFQKNAAELTVAESAVLAGSIKAPGRHAPHLDPDHAKDRARLVLAAMTETGSLSLLDAQLASYELDALVVNLREPDPAGYFLDYAASGFRPEPSSGDIVYLHTTLHPAYQAMAEKAVERSLTDEAMRKKGVSQAALIAMRPTGEIIAMIGGRDYAASQFNRATQAQRQPGSLFKTFVYDAAFRQGWRVNDLIVDSPLVMATPNSKDKLYMPANYNDRYYGVVSTQQAFAKSANVSALRLQEWAGRDNVITAARRAGLQSDLKPYASLGLGVSETTLLDMAAAYASLAAGRIVTPVTTFAEPGTDGALGSTVTPETLQLLYQNVRAGTGYAARLNVPVFGKTGTTQDHRDAWFIGFTDHLIVGVWVGNDSYEPMNKVTGGNLPAEIWKSFMADATKKLQAEAAPPRFARRSLLDIAFDQKVNRDIYGWNSVQTQRILGPATLLYDGSIDMGGIRIYFDGVKLVSGYGAYHQLYEQLDSYFKDRELVCEVNRSYASCRDGETDAIEHIVENGWARTTYRASGNLRRAQQRAREAGNGIWSHRRQWYSDPDYDLYDMNGLTQRQLERLEQQRAREEERMRQMLELYQKPDQGTIVIGRSAVGEEPVGSRINRSPEMAGTRQGLTGTVASESGL